MGALAIVACDARPLDGTGPRASATPAPSVVPAPPPVVSPSRPALFGQGPSPRSIRVGHSAILLGTHEVLLVGGAGTTAATSELVSLVTGMSRFGPELPAPQRRATATMLADGTVLLLGGDDGRTTAATRTATVYDPIAQAFRSVGPMVSPRTGHSAVRLRSGKVLVVGGLGDVTCEIYDPTTGRFTAGPPRVGRGPAASVELADGTVLVVASTDDRFPAQIFDPAANGGAGAFTTVTTTSPVDLKHTFPWSDGLTRLYDGRVVSARTTACFSAGGPFVCDAVVDVFTPGGPLGGTFQPAVKMFATGRGDFATSLLTSNAVLFSGGTPESSATRGERFEPGPPFALVDDGPLVAAHEAGIATLLPGGDTLVSGGGQAQTDLRVARGRIVEGPRMGSVRSAHRSIRLVDGRVLVTGGATINVSGAPTRSAEVYDPFTRTFASAGTMGVARYGHAMTVLASGKVLVTGGFEQNSAEIYDPDAPVGSRFRPTGSMREARVGHTSTLLPSGAVLVTGGCRSSDPGECLAADRIASAEVFDPATETFAAVPSMAAARAEHGAVAMANGKVLVAGGGTDLAEIFEPSTKTFRIASAPGGGARSGRSLQVLPNGHVLYHGGATRSAETFDPATETWSFTAPFPEPLVGSVYAPSAEGRFLVLGGRLGADGIAAGTVLFDVNGSAKGNVLDRGAEPLAERLYHSATLTGAGDVLVTGGVPCFGGCFGPSLDTTFLFGDELPAGVVKPALVEVPKDVVPGQRVRVKGTGFTSLPASGSGVRGSSATNHPLFTWVSLEGSVAVPGTTADFTDTEATWIVPTGGVHGRGTLFVASAGITGRGVPVTIASSPKGVACTFDAECGTGFCTDGICCDGRCDGACESCLAARKQTGQDGTCGAVPPGDDIAGKCFLPRGQACTSGRQCKSDFCAQGVCCDAACTGECQSCAQAGKVGSCQPIGEGTCAPVCVGDVLRQVGAPDVTCAPYRCSGSRCETTCRSARDCVEPSVCDATGACVAPPAPTVADDALCSCDVVGRPAGNRLAVLVGASALLAIVIRRRTKGARP